MLARLRLKVAVEIGCHLCGNLVQQGDELAHLRQPQAAARLMGFAEAHVPAITGPLSRADRHDLRRLWRLCRVQLPAGAAAPATLQAWRDAGRALPMAQGVGEALRA